MKNTDDELTYDFWIKISWTRDLYIWTLMKNMNYTMSGFRM